MCEPVVPFIHIRITEPCLYTYRQSSCFCCLYQFCCNFRTANKTASLSIRCHIMYRTAHIDIHTPEALFRHTNTHFSKVFGLIPPYMGNNWLFICSKSQAPAHTKDSLWVTITFRICKLCKKHIRSSCFTHYMPENNICHIFHWCQYKKRSW